MTRELGPTKWRDMLPWQRAIPPADPEATVDATESRRRFEAELQAADLDIPERERDKLFVLWQEYLPHRDALRGTPIMPEDEPTFIEKPTVRGGR